MPSRSRLATLATVLLLVLAGCGAGPTSQSPTNGTQSTAASTPTATRTATPTPAATATPDASQRYDIRVRNGTLPVDVNRTFARVQSLLGTDARPRPVELRNLSEWRGTLPRLGASPLNRALGFENVSVDWTDPTGVTRPSGYVYVHTGDGSPDEIERVLAHEFVHTVQFRTAMLPWMDRLDQPRLTLDLLKTRLALVEGGAVYATDAYVDRYLDVQNNSAHIRDIYRTRTDSHRVVLSHYRYGYRYVNQQIDSPANLPSVYENHPTTTEQILHNATPSEEPEASLSVSRNVSHPDWEYVGNNTVGELLLRTALRTELDRSRAVEAAAGWGTDELTVGQHVRNDSRFGWVWVHRWDTPADASEATDALSAYASARAADSPLSYRVRRVNATTTAFVFGDGAFVPNATVSDEDDDVTVTVGS
jgi:hypothetical protein